MLRIHNTSIYCVGLTGPHNFDEHGLIHRPRNPNQSTEHPIRSLPSPHLKSIPSVNSKQFLQSISNEYTDDSRPPRLTTPCFSYTGTTNTPAKLTIPSKPSHHRSHKCPCINLSKASTILIHWAIHTHPIYPPSSYLVIHSIIFPESHMRHHPQCLIENHR
jgi:hypothetical protein